MADKKNNTGAGNSGDLNSGDLNSGNYNSGYRNSGNYNSGDYNSGDYNSGDYNSGDCNSGDLNSGYRNSGNYNSGNYNSGYRNSGFFNTNEPTVRMFNKDTGKKRSEIAVPYLCLQVCEWVPESEMTTEQKKADKDFHVKGGTLVKRTYKEAWAKAWGNATKEIKQQFLDLPNFDAEIFREITGVDVEADDSCDGKVVEIDGKKYRLESVKE